MGSAMRRLLDELLGVLDERIHRLVVGGSISSDHGAAVPHEAIQLSSRAYTALVDQLFRTFCELQYWIGE